MPTGPILPLQSRSRAKPAILLPGPAKCKALLVMQATIDDSTFCGLPLDEDNEDDKTAGRVKDWVAQLKGEMSI